MSANSLNVFTYTDADLSLTEAEEARLIKVAQGIPAIFGTAGIEAAKTRLMEAYGPAIRAAVSRFKGGVFDGQLSPSASDYGTASRSIEDLQSAALVGFLEAIADHDPEQNPRLAGHLVHRLNRALSEEVEAAPAFAIPTRTLSRFYGIVRAADGDLDAAENLAGGFGMSREVFRDVRAAVGSSSLDDMLDESEDSRSQGLTASPVYAPSPVVDVEDRILVDMAFAAMNDDEARICEMAYGFTTYGEPLSDDAIGAHIGASRPAVQRRRNKALTKSRKALGATLADGADQ